MKIFKQSSTSQKQHNSWSKQFLENGSVKTKAIRETTCVGDNNSKRSKSLS